MPFPPVGIESTTVVFKVTCATGPLGPCKLLQANNLSFHMFITVPHGQTSNCSNSLSFIKWIFFTSLRTIVFFISIHLLYVYYIISIDSTRTNRTFALLNLDDSFIETYHSTEIVTCKPIGFFPATLSPRSYLWSQIRYYY